MTLAPANAAQAARAGWAGIHSSKRFEVSETEFDLDDKWLNFWEKGKYDCTKASIQKAENGKITIATKTK